MVLHDGNFARYRVRLSEFAAWRMVCRPAQLGAMPKGCAITWLLTSCAHPSRRSPLPQADDQSNWSG